MYILSPGELTYGMKYPEDEPRDLKYSAIQKLLEDNPGRKVVMFFPADHYYRLQARSIFPTPVSIRKSLESDPEDKDAEGQVMVRFQ